MENYFCCDFIVGYYIAAKPCTCHDSTAVPCAKFHSGHFPTTLTRAELNCHRIWKLRWKNRSRNRSLTYGVMCSEYTIVVSQIRAQSLSKRRTFQKKFLMRSMHLSFATVRFRKNLMKIKFCTFCWNQNIPGGQDQYYGAGVQWLICW